MAAGGQDPGSNRLGRHNTQYVEMLTLSTTSLQLSMKGFVVGPVRLKIGTNGIPKRSMWHPFDGFDVLVHRDKSELDMDQGTLLFDGQMLSLDEDSHQGPPQVARITAFQWRVIPLRFRSSTWGM